MLLGTAEIRVVGAKGVYASPTLISHYVAEHHYAPPADFLHGVLRGPGPTSEAYQAALLRKLDVN